MNPLDVVKRTPATNCGECGHSTCLAFGVAVTRGGESPSKCPYISLEGLSLCPTDNVVDGMEKIDNLSHKRDKNLAATLLQKVGELDLSSLASQVGGIVDTKTPDCIDISYLARTAHVSADGITIDGSVPEDPRDFILLSNYLTQGGGAKPDCTWVGMESLPNSISKVKALARDCETKIAQAFAKTPSSLAECCVHLGGRPGDQGASSDVDQVVYVLPRIPMLLLFWAEDEEDGFDARAKVLFDHRVLDIIDIESLVFASERLADSLITLSTRAA